MKLNKISMFAAGLCCMGLTMGCADELEIAQHGVLNYETYYQTDDDAQAATAAIYLEMRGLAYNYLIAKNSLTDDFWAAGGSRNDNASFEQLNEFTFGSDQDLLQGMFESYYKLVYKANVVLGHVSGDSETIKRCLAEARVFRAFAYFELTTMWGNPPIVDHELTPSEYACPNGSTEELWKLIESDLNEAIKSGALVSKTGLNDKATWQVTKEFAQALLGKAYLWQGKNSEAAAQLDAVISSGKYALYDGEYENVIQFCAKNNCESLFETIRVDDSNNTFDNWDFCGAMVRWRLDVMETTAEFDAIFGTSQNYGFLAPTKSLYDDFVNVEGVDGYRLNQTMKTYEQMKEIGMSLKPGNTVINEGYFMWKWRVGIDACPGAGYGFCYTNNFRWMRLAEVYLMAAEAHLATGNSSKCDEYMNIIRTRAKAPTKTGYTLADIQTEKRLELCGESVRFQDMLRWGIAYDRMKDQGKNNPQLQSNGEVKYVVYNNDATKFGFKQGKHEHLPYPQTEIDLNSAINQNPGW
ncbi:MAG: RagB/SusD family nutrient uptake outer membrane protein [Bacteroidales bacterium]|nr:RagB/SusD family nutrient uptake outer membrane protein [Bacteroidales bacterium]